MARAVSRAAPPVGARARGDRGGRRGRARKLARGGVGRRRRGAVARAVPARGRGAARRGTTEARSIESGRQRPDSPYAEGIPLWDNGEADVHADPRRVRRGRRAREPDPGVSRAARRRRHAGVGLRRARRAASTSFLLESVVGGATWAAYSFVGVAPRAVVRWQRAAPRRVDLVRRRRRRAAARAPSGRRPIRPRRSPRCSASCARSTCRACRGSGAARSAGSPTTACARSRICRRARSPGSTCRRCAWSSPTRW